MTEAKLSFGKIRDLVKSECLSDLGKEKCDQMSFLTNFDTILEEANRTNEFVRILQEEDFPTDGFYDVREAIQRIKVVGTYIEPAELFDLSRVVEAIGSIVSCDLYGNKDFDKILGIMLALNHLGYAAGSIVMNTFFDMHGTYFYVMLGMGVLLLGVVIMYQFIITAAHKVRKEVEAQAEK